MYLKILQRFCRDRLSLSIENCRIDLVNESQENHVGVAVRRETRISQCFDANKFEVMNDGRGKDTGS